jgi:fatty acid/phospholipid biosynthesis enzyme
MKVSGFDSAQPDNCVTLSGFEGNVTLSGFEGNVTLSGFEGNVTLSEAEASNRSVWAGGMSP